MMHRRYESRKLTFEKLTLCPRSQLKTCTLILLSSRCSCGSLLQVLAQGAPTQLGYGGHQMTATEVTRMHQVTKRGD